MYFDFTGQMYCLLSVAACLVDSVPLHWGTHLDLVFMDCDQLHATLRVLRAPRTRKSVLRKYNVYFDDS